MAISTVTIQNTIDWAKRLTFNRPMGIGNSLEPALTSANMVMQTILGPPFDWWWNNQEISFTCSTTAPTSAITNVALTSSIVTLNTVNTWNVNDQVLVSGLVTATFLNGALLTVLTASGSQITAFFNHANYVSAADTGTLTKNTTQDYPIAIPAFFDVEHASVYDSFTADANTQSGTINRWIEMEVKNELALSTETGRPQFISPHYEDSNGNMTFRVMPAPDQAYPVSLHIQLAPTQLTSLNSTWAPIPDFMQSIYSWGFLALMWAFADDPRVGFANQKFTAGLIARAEGISEEERDIFLNNWSALTGLQTMKTQQGVQARGI